MDRRSLITRTGALLGSIPFLGSVTGTARAMPAPTTPVATMGVDMLIEDLGDLGYTHFSYLEEPPKNKDAIWFRKWDQAPGIMMSGAFAWDGQDWTRVSLNPIQFPAMWIKITSEVVKAGFKSDANTDRLYEMIVKNTNPFRCSGFRGTIRADGVVRKMSNMHLAEASRDFNKGTFTLTLLGEIGSWSDGAVS